MLDTPYAGYILASYGLAALVVAVLATWVAWRLRSDRRALEMLERRLGEGRSRER